MRRAPRMETEPDMENLVSFLECSPVIASVKTEEKLDAALASPCGVIFLLCGDICTVSAMVERVHAVGKRAVVHLDLISGLAQKDAAVDFLAAFAHADGIISTRPNLVRRAKERGLFAVLRVFVIDSMALDNIARETAMVTPDVIEILPGVMPKVIRRLTASVRVPIIAGGLIADKEDIVGALAAGALAVSATSETLWQV